MKNALSLLSIVFVGGCGAALPFVRQIECSATQCCAVSSIGRVACWGDASADPRVPADRCAQPQIVNLPPVESVAVSDSHGCAVTSAGDVLCWGRSAVFYPDWGSGSSPRAVTMPGPADSVCVAYRSAHARLTDGRVVSWGSAAGHQLGVPVLDCEQANPDCRLRYPVVVRAADGSELRTSFLDCNAYSTCVVAGDEVECWGDLGPLPDRRHQIPHPPGISASVVWARASPDLVCLGFASDRVACAQTDWIGSLEWYDIPLRASVPVSLTAELACGLSGHSAACLRSGALGFGALERGALPANVGTLQNDGVIDIEAGSGFLCALGSSGVACEGLRSCFVRGAADLARLESFFGR
jgi:hypothetical protein